MSSLTDALNQIQVWLQSNYPAVADSITPGLSLEEIQEITRTLPFSLPDEVYELYQWSRGHDPETQTIYTHIFEPHEGMALCSLDTAIEIFPIFEDEVEECAVKYVGRPLFPIFQTDTSNLCVVGDWQNKKSSPIIFVSEINEIKNAYTSLTSMMLTLADCFEAGAVAFDKEGYNNWNAEKFASIYLKHNYKLLDFSLKRLKHELIMTQHDSILQEMTISNFLGDIYRLDRERRNLVTKQLGFEVIEPLITAMQDENERVRDLAKQALEELNYTFEDDSS
jgi:hypothetical protein